MLGEVLGEGQGEGPNILLQIPHAGKSMLLLQGCNASMTMNNHYYYCDKDPQSSQTLS